MDSLGEIKGEVAVSVESNAPVHAALFIMDNGVLDLVDHTHVDDGKYFFHALPDTYFVAAYVDINRDEIYRGGFRRNKGINGATKRNIYGYPPYMQ